jgi:hypothetical protein
MKFVIPFPGPADVLKYQILADDDGYKLRSRKQEIKYPTGKQK